jgi:hypothetical protein
MVQCLFKFWVIELEPQLGSSVGENLGSFEQKFASLTKGELESECGNRDGQPTYKSTENRQHLVTDWEQEQLYQ